MISNLSQLAQIFVNVLFFQTACSDLETLLVTLRCVTKTGMLRSPVLTLKPCRATQRGGTIHLDSLASFQQTLTQTQDRMVAQISQKVDTFFEEAQYPWTATQPPPPHTANDASGYLQDLIDYVSTVMMSVLIQLPEFAKNYVYRGALARCATVLQVRSTPLSRAHEHVADPRHISQSYLTDKEPRQISDAGLLHLARDVRWLVNHVKTLGNDRLADVFTELNQLVTLLTATPNITDYLDPQARSTRFHRVQPRALQTVLVKLLTFYNSPQGSGVGHRRRQQVVRPFLLVLLR